MCISQSNHSSDTSFTQLRTSHSYSAANSRCHAFTNRKNFLQRNHLLLVIPVPLISLAVAVPLVNLAVAVPLVHSRLLVLSGCFLDVDLYLISYFYRLISFDRSNQQIAWIAKSWADFKQSSFHFHNHPLLQEWLPTDTSYSCTLIYPHNSTYHSVHAQ